MAWLFGRCVSRSIVARLFGRCVSRSIVARLFGRCVSRSILAWLFGRCVSLCTRYCLTKFHSETVVLTQAVVFLPAIKDSLCVMARLRHRIVENTSMKSLFNSNSTIQLYCPPGKIHLAAIRTQHNSRCLRQISAVSKREGAFI